MSEERRRGKRGRANKYRFPHILPLTSFLYVKLARSPNEDSLCTLSALTLPALISCPTYTNDAPSVRLDMYSGLRADWDPGQQHEHPLTLGMKQIVASPKKNIAIHASGTTGI
jgi:hypothetical protein